MLKIGYAVKSHHISEIASKILHTEETHEINNIIISCSKLSITINLDKSTSKLYYNKRIIVEMMIQFNVNIRGQEFSLRK